MLLNLHGVANNIVVNMTCYILPNWFSRRDSWGARRDLHVAQRELQEWREAPIWRCLYKKPPFHSHFLIWEVWKELLR